MGSKENILGRLKHYSTTPTEKIPLTFDPIIYGDVVKKFSQVALQAKSNVEFITHEKSADNIIRHYFKKDAVASSLPDVACATINPDDITTIEELEKIKTMVVRGKIGVAENGAIWVTDENKYRSVFFICENLVILLDKKNIVNTMHEAYPLIPSIHNGFGTFIAGPSKTADIEQVLVTGAHGAKNLLIIIT